MDVNESNLRETLRDIELRLRRLEENMAVLLSQATQQSARVNYIPGWVIAGVGLAISAAAVLFSMWATGRTP